MAAALENGSTSNAPGTWGQGGVRMGKVTKPPSRAGAPISMHAQPLQKRDSSIREVHNGQEGCSGGATLPATVFW